MEVKDYPNYLIYEDGRVYSKKRKKFLKSRLEKKGYYVVDLCKDGKKKLCKIHRLIALHYIPLVDGKDMVDHIDQNKTNNDISNLRWVNSSENQRNTGVQKNNRSGHKHITLTRSDTYQFRLNYKNEYHSKIFKTLDECIKYRNNYMSINHPQRPLC